MVKIAAYQFELLVGIAPLRNMRCRKPVLNCRQINC
jgi:hypothetical protein